MSNTTINVADTGRKRRTIAFWVSVPILIAGAVFAGIGLSWYPDAFQESFASATFWWGLGTVLGFGLVISLAVLAIFWPSRWSEVKRRLAIAGALVLLTAVALLIAIFGVGFFDGIVSSWIPLTFLIGLPGGLVASYLFSSYDIIGKTREEQWPRAKQKKDETP